MSTINPNWPSWSTTSINASTITNTGNASTAAIPNDDVSAREVSVTIAYGGTVNQGAEIYILGDVDGANYEALTDEPWGFEMPGTTSTTYRRRFSVDPLQVASFKVMVVNNTGASITATVRIRAATMDVV